MGTCSSADEILLLSPESTGCVLSSMKRPVTTVVAAQHIAAAAGSRRNSAKVEPTFDSSRPASAAEQDPVVVTHRSEVELLEEADKSPRTTGGREFGQYRTPRNNRAVLAPAMLEEARMIAPFSDNALNGLYARFKGLSVLRADGLLESPRPTSTGSNQSEGLSPTGILDQTTISTEQFLQQHEFINHPLKGNIAIAMELKPGESMDFFTYIKKMDVFNVLGSLEPKTEFMFTMYDPEHTGYITIPQLRETLNALTGKRLREEELTQVLDYVYELVDQDDDGRISFEEFSKLVGRTDISSAISINHF